MLWVRVAHKALKDDGFFPLEESTELKLLPVSVWLCAQWVPANHYCDSKANEGQISEIVLGEVLFWEAILF